MPEKCDRCKLKILDDEREVGWPVGTIVGGAAGVEYICPDCFGDDAYCTVGHLLSVAIAESASTQCATCEAINVTEVLNVIREAKAAAGEHAYLWLHSSGDCILWADEDASFDDPGINALDRWQISETAAQAITDAHIVDGYA